MQDQSFMFQTNTAVCHQEMSCLGTSLVAQRLRIRLPMHGAWDMGSIPGPGRSHMP